MNNHVYDLLKWSVLSGGNGDGEKINNQDKTITENGTYTADDGYTGLGTVVVNVASGGGEEEGNLAKAIIERTITEISDDTVEAVGNSALRNCTKLTSVNLPNATLIESFGLSSCIVLKNVSIPNVTKLGTSAFSGCTGLVNIDLPIVTFIEGYGLEQCTALKTVSMPNVENINVSAFSNCKVLTSVEIKKIKSIGMSAFAYCKQLVSVQLPATPPKLSNTNAFTGINAACVFYIPTGSLAAYQAATNWSALTSTYTFTEEDR